MNSIVKHIVKVAIIGAAVVAPFCWILGELAQKAAQ